jgi:hypothetical protein
MHTSSFAAQEMIDARIAEADEASTRQPLPREP